MAILEAERSYVDLKSQVTINGVCYMFVSDVKYLLSDHSTAKVWSAGVFSIALWYVVSRHPRECVLILTIIHLPCNCVSFK